MYINEINNNILHHLSPSHWRVSIHDKQGKEGGKWPNQELTQKHSITSRRAEMKDFLCPKSPWGSPFSKNRPFRVLLGHFKIWNGGIFSLITFQGDRFTVE